MTGSSPQPAGRAPRDGALLQVQTAHGGDLSGISPGAAAPAPRWDGREHRDTAVPREMPAEEAARCKGERCAGRGDGLPRGPGQSSGAAPGGTSVKRVSSTAAAGAELAALHSAWPSVRWERGWGCRGGVAQAELLARARRTPTTSLPAPAPRGFLPLRREAGVWMSEI